MSTLPPRTKAGMEKRRERFERPEVYNDAKKSIAKKKALEKVKGKRGDLYVASDGGHRMVRKNVTEGYQKKAKKHEGEGDFKFVNY